MSTWRILYRGSLSSCNYACSYCPLAKSFNAPAELQQDQHELERFVSWIAALETRIGILFTPWGEALVHQYYRKAITVLSRLPHVCRVAIQTNLSAPLGELAEANRSSLALWTTFHPGEVPFSRFVASCHDLDTAGIRYSVGVVGLREHFDAIERLRRELRPAVYIWINAFKRVPGYYQPHEIARLLEVDPYFHWNLHTYSSGGRACSAGETMFAVDGAGNVRRCHFISEIIGNIYDPDFGACLKNRACSAATCGCHIGYVHRPALRLSELYGPGLLERIPARWPEVSADFARAVSLNGESAARRFI